MEKQYDHTFNDKCMKWKWRMQGYTVDEYNSIKYEIGHY